MLRLHTFGGLSVERNGAPVAETAEQHKALAVLALVALGAERGLSRDRLAAYLWPESDAERARGALSQTLYVLRKQLAEPELFIGTRTLRLNSATIGADVWDFQHAVDEGDEERAVGLYTGPFLDGFFVPNAGELERWVEQTRAELTRRVAGTLESLARAATARGDHEAAVAWWRRSATLEPGNSRVAAGLVGALAQVGDRAAALEAAQSHQKYLREELAAPADPAVSQLVEEIRSDAGMRGGPAPVEPHPHGNTSAVLSGPASTDGTSAMNAPTPRRHLVRLATLTAALFVAGVVGVLGARRPTTGRAPVLSERRIAVAGFDNETGDTALASIGRLATEWVMHGLVQTQLVEVVAPGLRASALSALGDSDRAPGAGLIVRGAYSRTGDSLVVQAQVVEAASGRVVRAVGPVTGPMHEPLMAIEQLRQEIAGALATRVDPRLVRWSDAASQPTSFAAYRAFDEGLNTFFSGTDSTMALAGRMLVHAAALDSNFSLPLLWAVYAFLNTGDDVRRDSVLRVLEQRRERLPRFDRALLDAHVSAVRNDAVGAYEALRRVVAIAPNSEWLFKLADAAAVAGRMAEADSLLDVLDPDAGWMREWDTYWALRADVRYTTNNHRGELAALAQLAVRYPSRPDARRQARTLAAFGRDREALAVVDDMLRRSPADPEPSFRVLSAARVHGRLELARAVAARALRIPPTNESMPADDSARAQARFHLLVFEASEMWDSVATGARRLARMDSVAGHHDALPYLALLQVALRRGASGDTAGLEARALREASARSASDGADNWKSESPLAVQAALAALHRDVTRTATVLREGQTRGVWDYFWFSERPVFDAVRGEPALRGLLHNPALDSSH